MARNEFQNNLVIYTNLKGIKELRRIISAKPKRGFEGETWRQFYHHDALASGFFDTDKLTSISKPNFTSSGCEFTVVSFDSPSFNFQDHITILASQGDKDTVSVNHVYYEGSLKLIRFAYSDAYDSEYSNDEFFFNEILETAAFSGSHYELDETTDFSGGKYEFKFIDQGRSSTKNRRDRANKSRGPWDFNYFALVTSTSYVGPERKELAVSSNRFMWLRDDIYQPVEFLDLSNAQLNSITEFPFESSYDFKLGLQNDTFLDDKDFNSVLHKVFELNPLLRVILTKRRYDFFKEYCRLESSACFVVSCRSLPYSEPEDIVFETSKEKFLAFLNGAVGVEQGENFVVQGDIALNWWYFNYLKAGTVRVDYLTSERVCKLYYGSIDKIVGSLMG